MTVRITPLSLERAIGHVTFNGKRLPIYPNHDYVTAFNRLLERTGGATTDLVQAALESAKTAQATAEAAPVAAVAAYDSGAPTTYTLNPANPISKTIISLTQARADVAAHTRTPSGMSPISLNAGSVTIARGVNYSIYYVDPTDAGGAVTYLATEDPSVAGDYANGARLVGAAFVALPKDYYGSGDGTVLP